MKENKGYNFITSVSIRLFPALGDDIFINVCINKGEKQRYSRFYEEIFYPTNINLLY